MKVLVDKFDHPFAGKVLDLVAGAVESAGGEVERWEGEDERESRESLAEYQLLVTWVGHEWFGRLPWYVATTQPMLCLSPGWFNPYDSVQTGLRKSEPVHGWPQSYNLHTPRPVQLVQVEGRDSRDVLVLLQDTNDANLHWYSPWWRDQASWLQGLHAEMPSTLRFRLWRPPDWIADPEVVQLQARIPERFVWAEEPLDDELDETLCVATLNSPYAMRAVAHHSSVLAFAHSPFHQVGAVHCVDDNLDRLHKTLRALMGRRTLSPVRTELQDELVRRAGQNQVKLDTLTRWAWDLMACLAPAQAMAG